MKKQLSLAMAGVMPCLWQPAVAALPAAQQPLPLRLLPPLPRAPQRALLLRATFSTRLLPLPSLRMLP